jgi:hypothetical protein
MSMERGWLNVSSASYRFLGKFRCEISSLVAGVLSLMLDNRTQSIVVCQSLYLDLMCSGTMWSASVLTSQIPWMKVRFLSFASFKRCTSLSVTKWDWDALSSNALHGTYWPKLFFTCTIAVGSITYVCGFLLNAQYILIFVFEVPSGVDYFECEFCCLLFFCLEVKSMCNNVWCFLLHFRQENFKHTCAGLYGFKQLKRKWACLANVWRCLGCIPRNFSHF